MKTLLLTSRDIAQLVTEADALSAVKQAFQAYGQEKAVMPSKIYLDLPRYHGDFRAMPAYIEDLKACGLKWVNAHPDNILQKKYPAVMAVLILNDPVTGFPLAIMDGTLITRLRTGAAGALASFYLARKESSVLGLVGCGVQAEAQLMSHLNQFQFHEIVVWGQDRKLAYDFKERMGKHHSKIQVVEDLEELAQKSHILCTTTPSRKPLINRDWVGPGLHINAMGADAQGKQELDPQILKDAYLVVDDLDQSIHGGEINVPFSNGVITEKDIDATLGEVVCGRKLPRQNPRDITVFDSTGLAIQDMALARRVYEQAIEKGLGTFLGLI